MADIVGAVDAPSDEEAAAEGGWMNSDLWASLNEKMLTHLQSISLRQLVAEQRTKGVTLEPAPAPAVKRGVFAKPKSTLKITAPNSVFALAGTLMPSRGGRRRLQGHTFGALLGHQLAQTDGLQVRQHFFVQAGPQVAVHPAAFGCSFFVRWGIHGTHDVGHGDFFSALRYSE